MLRTGGFLDERERETLAAIIRTHVATGEPVGSLVLARQSREGLSSATVRNVCAELESEGYLTHPHTSAGRVPTDKGYRYYVDNLMGSTKVSRSDVARINERLLGGEVLTSPGRLMERTSQLLSLLSGNVGIVIPPSIGQDTLHHIEFLKLPDSRILVITASGAGRVHDQVIMVDCDFPQDELNTTARFLVENFRGWTLTEIRDELLRRMTEERALYDKLLQNAVKLCSESLHEADQPDVFIEGASSILTKPDFADTERMRALFRMLEQKGRIVKILNECIQSAPPEAVVVRIGAENRSANLRACTVIASPCFYRGGAVAGSIGVVGPTRIEYDRLIGIVNYIAKLFERVLDPESRASH
jgi:heat-inducible transcriptional repressor